MLLTHQLPAQEPSALSILSVRCGPTVVKLGEMLQGFGQRVTVELSFRLVTTLAPAQVLAVLDPTATGSSKLTVGF